MHRIPFATLVLFVAGCATGRPALPLPPDVIAGIEVRRPGRTDARRYDLAAWGEGFLLEFRTSAPGGRQQILRIYPEQTVCTLQHRSVGSLFLFRPGSAVPDEDVAVEAGSRAEEIRLAKARFEVLSAEKACLERCGPRAHVVVVGSASRTEVSTPESATSLSERRARAVAVLVRRARPDLADDQVDVMALGWDGFARPDDLRGAVAVFGGAPSADELPVLFTGPPLSAPLQERLRSARPAPVLVGFAGSDDALSHPDLEEAERRWREALAPFFAALQAGCRLDEPRLHAFLDQLPSVDAPAEPATTEP